MPAHESGTSRGLQKLADAIWNRPWLFLVPQLFLFAGCIYYTLGHLQFTTSRADLVSDQVKHQRDFLEFKREFQLPDALVAVVESESLEKNRRFVERLAFKVSQEPELFANTYYKGDLSMMGPKGLLFLSEENLEELRDAIRDQWPFIEAFSEAGTLNEVFRLVNRQLREGDPAEMTREEVAGLLPVIEVFRRMVDEMARSIVQPLAGSFPGLAAFFGEQTRIYLTFAGGEMYALITHATSPAIEEKAVIRLRELVRATQNEVPGVNAEITGEVVLNYDEMTQARQDVTVATLISVGLVALIFIYGFHEIARPLLATLSLLVGIAYALAFATFSVGRLNLLSITLMPVLIGLAIDFGVHLISRFEEELASGNDRRIALGHALAHTGMGIFTTGFATAGAFFAMMFTDFKGIQEMGFLSGAGLLLCLIPMMTLLPVLLLKGSAKLPPEKQRGPERRPREVLEQVWLQRPKLVVLAAAILTLLALTQFPRLRFDYNLLNLQSSGLPAVGIEEKLIQSGSQSFLYGVVVAGSLEEATKLVNEIENLEGVASVSSMAPYLTEDQTRKLQLIREIKQLVGRIELPSANAEPVDVMELNETLFALQGYLGIALEHLRRQEAPAELLAETEALRGSIVQLRSLLMGDAQVVVPRLTIFQRAVFGDLRETIRVIKEQDIRRRLLLRDIPPFLRERFISPSGRFLIEVHPKADLWQRENQQRFIEMLRSVDPNVTGTLVQVYEYTSLIKENALRAGACAAGVIMLVLLVQFRRLSSVVLGLLPVVLGLCWLLGLMGLFGFSFNPVNIMALTLLVGIGAANGVHILQRFAEDPCPAILSRSTGKAVVVSGFTTMAGFGSLMVAKHQGIASLGQVMAVGTISCMIASLAVLPALLTLLHCKRKPEPAAE